jgi:hypothetical protein
MANNRPLSDIRPIGPLFTSSDVSSEDVEEQASESDLQLPDDIDKGSLAKLRANIEADTGASVDMQDALAVHVLEAPMLQSYVSNTLSRVEQVSDEVTAESVIHSDATEEYARKLGATDQLEAAQEVYS